MKPTHVLRLGLIVIFVTFSMQLISCGGDPVVDDTPTEVERVTTILTSHNWQIQSVTVDGVDQTALFTGLAITFTASGFTTTNGDPVWPANGTWTFTNETATSFTRSDGLEVTIIQAVDTSLKLQLTWSKSTIGGSSSSVAGVHLFSMI